MPFVYDTSALLASVFSEPGGGAVVELAVEHGGFVSAANWAECASKLAEQAYPTGRIEFELKQFGLDVVPLSASLALQAGLLRPATKVLGLSLGDRCCLALAASLDATVVTADHAWAKLPGFKFQFIR
ncbi:MAG: type II toxin-antitoxin system VapC family toxin [Roseateles sp.]|uniref:type II toxin-antitoxin system VapC family toxin n=1 Tax=Roseateles sp. TaxID=1971397 RepID=UPI0039E902E3